MTSKIEEAGQQRCLQNLTLSAAERSAGVSSLSHGCKGQAGALYAPQASLQLSSSKWRKTIWFTASPTLWTTPSAAANIGLPSSHSSFRPSAKSLPPDPTSLGPKASRTPATAKSAPFPKPAQLKLPCELLGPCLRRLTRLPQSGQENSGGDAAVFRGGRSKSSPTVLRGERIRARCRLSLIVPRGLLGLLAAARGARARAGAVLAITLEQRKRTTKVALLRL
eukprot:scaffold464_cov244-Pinguiococcus_pyrenoidosus.AAC.10